MKLTIKNLDSGNPSVPLSFRATASARVDTVRLALVRHF